MIKEMDFSAIIGQDRALELLKRVIKKDRLPHAFLFAGPEGVGKKLAAIVFAKALNCIDRKGADPCCSCSSCVKLGTPHFFHPDIKVFKDINDPIYLRRGSVMEVLFGGSLIPREDSEEEYLNALRILEEENILSLRLSEGKGGGALDAVYLNRDEIFSSDKVKQGYYIEYEVMAAIQQKLLSRNQTANSVFRYLVSSSALFYSNSLKIGESGIGESVRGIISDIYMKPVESRKKVFIIDNAHRMTEEAADCFLKTLEEPPPDSILILVTSKPAAILQTIRSRCETVRFAPLKSGEIKEFLSASASLQEEHSFSAAILSSGSPANALSFDYASYSAVRDFIEALLSGESKLSNFICFPLFEQGILDASRGYEIQKIRNFMEIFLRIIRDLIFYKSGIDGEFCVSMDKIIHSKAFGELSVGTLDKLFFHGCDALERLQSNENQELLLENFLLDVTAAL